MPNVFCSNCNRIVNAGNFCSNCARPLDTSQPNSPQMNQPSSNQSARTPSTNKFAYKFDSWWAGYNTVQRILIILAGLLLFGGITNTFSQQNPGPLLVMGGFILAILGLIGIIRGRMPLLQRYGKKEAGMAIVIGVCTWIGGVLITPSHQQTAQPASSSSGSAASSNTSSKALTARPSPAIDDAEAKKDELVYDKIKERARKDHPDDYTTQKYVYETQVQAYKYMKTVPPSKLKSKIERDHPYDYTTQKYVYETQIEAKEYMDSLPPSRIKDKVQRDHPNDYTTQKYVYDRQVEAKDSMK